MENDLIRLCVRTDMYLKHNINCVYNKKIIVFVTCKIFEKEEKRFHVYWETVKDFVCTRTVEYESHQRTYVDVTLKFCLF